MDSFVFSDLVDHLIEGNLSDEAINSLAASLSVQDGNSIRRLRDEMQIRARAKNRMAAVFEGSPQPILITNRSFLITGVNPAFSLMSGVSDQALIGTNLYETFPPLFEAATKDSINRHDDSAPPLSLEFPSGIRYLDQYVVYTGETSGVEEEILLIYKDITIRVAAEQEAEKARWKLAHDYGERVKEQRLFYSTASLIHDESKDIEDVLGDVTLLIPPGWQYPDITAARIIYRDDSFATLNYTQTPWIQRAEFYTKSDSYGCIEVVYLEERSPEYEGPFLLEERNLINSLAEMLTIYLDRKENEQKLAEKMHDLGERVKEQRLFYSTASLIQDENKDIKDVLDEVTQLIPPGWQYPDITAARITYRDDSYATLNYIQTPWIQRVEFHTMNDSHGCIEVVYLKECAPEHEGPFLLEERNLINSLAEMLTIYLDRKENEQKLAEKMHDLGERVKEQRLFYSTASLIQDESKDITEVLSEVALLIPPGWQYPDITAACIRYNSQSYTSPGFRSTEWMQRALFSTRSGSEGVVEVAYLQHSPPEHEGPFLLEERNLINSLAEMLKTYLERKEGEKELEARIIKIEEIEHLHDTIVQQIPMPVLLIDESQHILVTNDAYIALTGYTHEQVLNMNPRDITVLSYTGEGLRELMRDQRRTFGELMIEFPVGIRTLEQYGIPIFNLNGSLENYLIVYNDITPRIEKEKEVASLLKDARTLSDALSTSAAALEGGMARMAEGDLSWQVHIDESDPLFRIKEDYNKALIAISALFRELNSSIASLKVASDQTISQTSSINDLIGEVVEKVQDSTDGARQQLKETLNITDQIQSLSTILDEVGSTVDLLLGQAEKATGQGEAAKTLGNTAGSTMESVGTISKQSMDQITDLNNRMTEIDKIVRLIADISSQTNLLALNAAIEAARAGEHGRGFAVVAQEVKNLAGQSKAATGQIEELIRSIQLSTGVTVESIKSSYDKIQAGIESVTETVQAIAEISSVVGDIRDEMREITRATHNQREMMTGILSGVSLLSRESEENLQRMEIVSGSVEQTSASTTSIASSSLEISDLASRLKIKADRFTLRE
ncbi:MAG TPA: methyl-accepting chemotaxis protein [Methanospirillum sp.]|nr:methyl-accepting chemotaxis protein [Methanospirillum sp.]